jgi:nucleoid-associated protein YgaU
VAPGDTLWAISERFYGDGSKYMRIAEASGISNPDLIHPGQVLTIP